MDVVKTLRYRFVRYCVNKAYAEIDLKDAPAEVVNVFDEVVNQIRDLEKYFTSLEAAESVFREDMPERLAILKERSPEIAREFVEKMVQYCMELDEVANSPVRPYIEALAL